MERCLDMSLPSRERGLKYKVYDLLFRVRLSLPSRERGLKLTNMAQWSRAVGSLPSRERGLKLSMASSAYILLAGRSLHGSVD